MPRLTLLSDRQQGIVYGVLANFPTAFREFRMQHLTDSLKKEIDSTVLVNLQWEHSSEECPVDPVAAIPVAAAEYKRNRECRLRSYRQVGALVPVKPRYVPPPPPPPPL
ncbi:hypothetical protein M0R45_010706 [Rubus argutus]|uniref:Uncharacterized protein n=1 Tax=Rubus argutus TaxID=59490 RepID=A0AAW1YB54_RUBAR